MGSLQINRKKHSLIYVNILLIFLLNYYIILVRSELGVKNIEEKNKNMKDKNEVRKEEENMKISEENLKIKEEEKDLKEDKDKDKEKEIKKINFLNNKERLLVMANNKNSMNRKGRIISRRKPVAQSSRYDNIGTGDKIVDGNKSTDYRSASCGHTKESNYPWFRIDLQKNYYIDRVEVLNRRDCCADRLINLNVMVTEQKFDDPLLIDTNDRCGSELNRPGKPGELIKMNCSNRYGRYVTVFLNKKYSILNICEVEVFEGIDPYAVTEGQQLLQPGNFSITVNVH